MRSRGLWTGWLLFSLVGGTAHLAAQTPPATSTSRDRAKVEAGSIDRLQLEASGEGSSRRWRYSGHWFTLECTAEEELTRRAVMRMEQVFTVFGRLLPPRVKPESPLRILLFGSLAEYRDHLQARNLPNRHAAMYVVDWNLIVAGSDLARFSEQLQQVRREHTELRDEIATLKKELPDLLRNKRTQLDKSGGSEANKRQAFLNYKRRWDDELAGRERSLEVFDRKNDALFREATEAMFATLFHEAFHAYLQNHVYPPQQHDLPRWLNEGLAQVFESGSWENGALRLDAPHREKLLALQGVLRSPESLPLAKVLAADGGSFLLFHQGSSNGQGGSNGSSTHYSYSWGLAYYLTFERQLLGTAALDEFVSASAKSLSPVRRFEQLTGQPLQEFEPQWRKYVLGLRAGK